MELNRREEIRKAVAKKDIEMIKKISKEELIEYIQDTQLIILTHCQTMLSNM